MKKTKRWTPYWFRESSTRLIWFIDGIYTYQLDCRMGVVNSPFYTVSVLGQDRKYDEIGAIPTEAVNFAPKEGFFVDASFVDTMIKGGS